MHTVTINDQTIEADEFAWDGCHKIYVATTEEGRDELASYGFYDFLPVEELQRAYDESCPLRFISSADLKDSYIPQFFEDETGESVRVTVEERI